MSASTWPGPTEGSWSISPTISSAAFVRHRLEQRVHQQHVDHRGLVDDQQVAVERALAFRLKPPPLGSTSSRRWIVLASCPVVSFSRLAARPVGAPSRRLTRLGCQNAQDRLHDRGLADAWSTGDHEHLGRQRQAHGRSLGRGELEADPLFNPGHRLVGINRVPRAAGRASARAGGPRWPARLDRDWTERCTRTPPRDPPSPCPRSVRGRAPCR